MKTFTFISSTADRLIEDLDNAIVLQHGNDIDEFGDYIYRITIEFGDYIYRITIEPKDDESVVKNVPMNQEDMINFLFGEEFAEYGIVEN